MPTLSRFVGVLVLVGASAACAAAVQPKKTDESKANPQALVLQDFRSRIDKYMELHNQAAKKSPPPEETADTAKITAAKQILTATIQTMRKHARPGDIFTPAIRARFRQLLYPELKGSEGRETRSELKEDAPAAIPLKVNAAYPEGQPLPTLPPNSLVSLPVLPEELEYRIIDRHLILRDVDANIIVDFIANAIRL